MSEVVCHIVEETLSFSVVEEAFTFSVVEEPLYFSRTEETVSFAVAQEEISFSLEASCYSPEDMQDILDISFDLGYF